MQTLKFKKLLAACAVVGATVLASNAQATLLGTTFKIDFDGGFYMLDSKGKRLFADQPVTGEMTMTVNLLAPAGPYDGTANMQSVIPFFSSHWSAIGDIQVYQTLGGGGAPGYCAGSLLCADAEMDFFWNNFHIPVDASFSLDPNFGFDLTNPSTLVNAWNNGNALFFDVNSIDGDGDGIAGTKITQSPLPFLNGWSPIFFGNAIITEVCTLELSILLIKTSVCSTIPQGLELPQVTLDLTVPPSAVPVPAAVWLFGSGLLGLVGMGYKKRSQA